ncbi:MAG: hypothetical protein HY660_00315 [Armatimonadetes bacterium]|nr:hypothetical protein [Armatimonadota bacterium]
MRKMTVLVLALGLSSVVFSGVAFAQQYPNVANLKAFSPEAKFMSLPGYLRYLVHQQTGQWMTYAEASRTVQQQTAGR